MLYRKVMAGNFRRKLLAYATEVMGLVHEDETLEDLQLNGLKIIQKQKGFRFGTDAVVLSDFIKETGASVLDMCTGTGVIAILLAEKTNAHQIYALELQPEIADMAKRSVILNSLEDKIKIKQGDIKESVNLYGKRSMDCVTVNPPYKVNGTGLQNLTETQTISRHEVCCTLEDVIEQASLVLCAKGYFYMVHRPERLVDILEMMRKYRIEPGILQFVHCSPYKKPVLVLIRGTNLGGRNLTITEPLYLQQFD